MSAHAAGWRCAAAEHPRRHLRGPAGEAAVGSTAPHTAVDDQQCGYSAAMSDTIPAIEQGSVVISPEHVRELRVLPGEVRKQQYAPATCGHNNNAAVELAGYLRALLGPEPMPQATRRPEQALPRPRMPA